MAGHWIQKATSKMERKGTKGVFSAAARRHGMSTHAFAEKEKNSSNPTERKRANFALNVAK